MIIAEILGVIPFLGAAFIATMDGEPYIQYGALGLCAIVVVFLCKFLNSMLKQMAEKDEQLTRLTQQNIQAYNRLAELLKDRPCLYKDRRIDDRAEAI